jgi:hypothetical protein
MGFPGFEIDPQVRRDSWEHDQSYFERQAEQLVEEELMQAGKLSGLFDQSRSSSATSTNPTSSMYSHLTASLISIESCDSNEDRNDGNVHYQLSNESDDDGSDTEHVAATKQLGKQAPG